MSQFAKVTMFGTLTQDPRTFTTNGSGTNGCSFSLAVNRNYNDRQGQRQTEVTFVDVTLYGPMSQTLAPYMRKGQHLIVHGRLIQKTWQDKTTGMNRSKLEVVAENIDLLPRAQSGAAADAPAQQEQEPAPAGAGVDDPF